jgi:cell division septation protein DedD
MQPKEPTFDRNFNQDNFEQDEAAESPALARRRQLLGGQHSAGDFTANGDEPRQHTLLPEAELESAAPEADPDIPPVPAGAGRSATYAPRTAPAAARARPRRGLLYLGGAAVVIIGALGWWLWPRGTDSGTGEVPLVVAEQGPEKVRPQEEGGMQVPNQDIRIYNELTGNQQSSEPEVLLPAPETPMTPPAATVDTAPATGTTATTGEAPAPPVVPAPPAASTAPAEADVAPAAGAQTAEAPAQTAQPPAAEQTPPSAPAAGQAQSTAPAANTTQTQPTAPATTPEQPAKPQTQTAAVGSAYRVQLAAVKSADAAKAAWTKMTKANPDALKGLSLKVVKVDRADGALYRVQGGPLADRAAADSVCSRLKQAGQACMVVAP